MRLTLSKSNHMNANISDDRGNILYNISTPSAFLSKKVTTITKYSLDDEKRDSVTLGIIEWPRMFDKGLFRFNGQVIPIDKMFEKHTWQTGLYFTGSDRQRYKWKLQSHLWMKYPESDEELVRYHRKNLGILKPSHPAYLDVSPKVAFMLDLIILTFVYAEWLLEQREAAQAANRATVSNSVAAATAGC